MRIGIFGGTFNPIHNGHIELAQYCRRELGLDKIIIMPTFTPPHKLSPDLASSEHRLKMCEIATAELDGFEVSDLEVVRGGKSYTFETLISLKEIYPNDELFFITGADMFLTLAAWKNPELIFTLATIVTIPRDSDGLSELDRYYTSTLMPMGAKAAILANPVTQVSSTFIRDNVGEPKRVESLINPRVYSYIINNNLYRK